MPIKLNLTGKVSGRITAISQCGMSKNGKLSIWLCKCSCGNESKVSVNNFPKTFSCGCLKLERLVERSTTHGLARDPIYNTWSAMRSRCNNKNNKSYPNYGGRGITVCESWNSSFQSFFNDMGRKPSAKHSLERNDNNGNYEKSNCSWATRTEQTRNTRQNKIITFNNRSMCLTDWAIDLNMPVSTLHFRLNRLGWSVEKALTQKVRAW